MNAPDSGRGLFARQEAARAALARAKSRIPALERDRYAALLGDSDIEAVVAIDEQIAHQRRVLTACQDRVTALSRPLSSDELSALGLNSKYHPITGMVLEDGLGAWAPDRQAREIHLPIIAKRDGEAVAAAMLKKINAAAAA
jgi:ethanolamine ammonia-lyase small subunit